MKERGDSLKDVLALLDEQIVEVVRHLIDGAKPTRSGCNLDYTDLVSNTHLSAEQQHVCRGDNVR